MIKFFRQIRQKLISEGNNGRYFKYAIGEIILVVIGILIAVQINNWNIKLQNEEKEILYLTRLTTNLGSDVRLYKSIIEADSLLIDELKEIKSDLKGFAQSIEEPVRDFNLIMKGYKFSSNTTVIDNLISSGQIELLRSNNLVEKILAYYRQTEHVETTIEMSLASQNNETTNQLILKFNSELKTEPSYITTIKNYVDFRIHLIQKQLNSYNSQKTRAQRLIDDINEEIELIETVY